MNTRWSASSSGIGTGSTSGYISTIGGGGYDGRGGSILSPISTPYHDNNHKEKRRQTTRMHAVLEQTGGALIKTAKLSEPSINFADHARGIRSSSPSHRRPLPQGRLPSEHTEGNNTNAGNR